MSKLSKKLFQNTENVSIHPSLIQKLWELAKRKVKHNCDHKGKPLWQIFLTSTSHEMPKHIPCIPLEEVAYTLHLPTKPAHRRKAG